MTYPLTRRHFVYGLLAVLWGVYSNAAAQESRSLNVGALFYNTNAALTSDDLLWPRARSTGPASDADRADRLELLETYGVIIGVRHTWTDASGVTRDLQIAQIAQNKFSDIEAVTPPVAGAFKRTYRNPFPAKILDAQEWTDVQAKTDPVDPNLPADVVIYNHLNTWTGIDIERWAYAFANNEHQDYIILEHKFTNTSGEVRNDVYFGLTAEAMAHTYFPADLWGTYYGATYANFVAGDASADSMRLYYAWDADQTSNTPTIDDRAKPDPQWGTFWEPQYLAYAVLHADASATDESDDPTKPWKAGWSQRELAPDLNVAGHEDIFAYLSQGWDPANPGAYAVTVDADGNVVPGKNGPYRILDPTIDINNTTQFDPLTEQEKTALFSFGPYTLQPGEDVRIVTAFAAGSIPHRWAIDAGRAYTNGNPQQFPLVPLPYDIPSTLAVDRGYLSQDEYDAIQRATGGQTIAQQGATLDKQTKNAILNLGRPLAFLNASKAIRTWKGGNVQNGQGAFNIPLAPAAPSLEGFSENDQVRLSWGREAETGAQAGAIEKYRIYREFTRPSALELPTDTTFLLHAEVPAGTFEFVDTDVVRGEDYYYYVAAVTTDGIESSDYLNRTGVTSDKVLEALAPTRTPDPGWEQNVVVVPNPFHIQGAFNYAETRRLNFLNLPAYANVHIYTMTGDRIQTLHHDGNTGDQDWEKQETFSTMEIVSGIYIYVVEELDGPRGRPTGRQAIGKFVVIK